MLIVNDAVYNCFEGVGDDIAKIVGFKAGVCISLIFLSVRAMVPVGTEAMALTSMWMVKL